MLDINKAIDIIKEFLSRITAKRLAVYVAYLVFLGWVFAKRATMTLGLDNADLICFIGVPSVITLALLYMFTRVGGGDEMVAPKETKKGG
jgi:hypothetical protein